MNVGELKKKLAIYEDDIPVYVQAPNDVDVWPTAEWLGESEDGEIVFVAAARPKATPDKSEGESR